MDRTHLLAKFLDQSVGVTLEDGGVVTGFALLRRFGRGRVVGPIVATDLGRAKVMISSLLGRHVSEFVRIDVPKERGLCAWLSNAGLIDAGTVFRMVRGTDATAKCSLRTFGLASQAYG
jgi:hypothetical protein